MIHLKQLRLQIFVQLISRGNASPLDANNNSPCESEEESEESESEDGSIGQPQGTVFTHVPPLAVPLRGSAKGWECRQWRRRMAELMQSAADAVTVGATLTPDRGRLLRQYEIMSGLAIGPSRVQQPRHIASRILPPLGTDVSQHRGGGHPQHCRPILKCERGLLLAHEMGYPKYDLLLQHRSSNGSFHRASVDSQAALHTSGKRMSQILQLNCTHAFTHVHLREQLDQGNGR